MEESIVDKFWREKKIAQIKEEIPFLKSPTRDQIVKVTHETEGYDQFIFWVSPSGDKVLKAPEGHLKAPPHGDKSIFRSPTHKGWLRGRAARLPGGRQLIVIYLEPGEFLRNTYKMHQLRRGLRKFPIPVDDTAVVVDSDGEILGTVMDIRVARKEAC